MGFLDHSQSNIIVDAVLTDVGRKFLANNDGSFRISYFSLADDEIDYSIIKKFGLIIGKEKIEKNTPIFEAQTSSNLALKHTCVTATNPNLKNMPKVEFTTGYDTTSTGMFAVTLTKAIPTKDLTFTQKFSDTTYTDPSLIDSRFFIKIPDAFLTIKDQTPDYVDREGIAYYSINQNVTVGSGASAGETSKVSFTTVRRSISDSQFSVYGNGTNINLVVSITGNNSGMTKIFKVILTKT
jgi:hypothetical protein